MKAHVAAITAEGAKAEAEWNEMFRAYAEKYPELAKEYAQWHSDEPAADLLNDEDFWKNEGDLATRAASEKVLQKVAKVVPNLFGGSADLAPSNKSQMKDREYYSKENPAGSNVHFGIREFAMTAIANRYVCAWGRKTLYCRLLCIRRLHEGRAENGSIDGSARNQYSDT